LVNPILTAIPTYWMSIFLLPKWVIKTIDRMRRDFLWSGPDFLHNKIRLISWTRLCRTSEQGGWGILNLRTFNCALLGKWWWKITTGDRWCGEMIIKENYFQNAPFWNLYHKQPRRRSFFWNGLLPSLPAFRKNVISLVKDGSSTLFWQGIWVEGRAPAEIWPNLFQLTHWKKDSISDFASRSIPFHARDFPNLCTLINDQLSHLASGKDEPLWTLTASRKFTVKSFYNFLNDGGLRCCRTPIILRNICLKKISLFN